VKYPIVKPYLPPLETYQSYIADIFDRNYLTNNGPLVRELEQKLADYLVVDHLLVVANGTLALQIAYAALDIKGTVLTTPFSFAPTASSLCWQGLSPEFIDIDSQSLNLDIGKVSQQQWVKAKAILPVHVFGNPCEVEKIQALAEKNDVKVIYDAAHAFGSLFNDTQLLAFGDASAVSFHATKLFQCIEGGAVIFKNKSDYDKAKQMINFGFDKNNMPESVGINAKMSEMHAAMGLAVFDNIDFILNKRSELIQHYHEQLLLISQENVKFQVWHSASKRNGAYMPVLFNDESVLLKISDYLTSEGINTRRYFYPSLSQIEVYGLIGETPIANDVASRILCLPMYTDLELTDIDYICGKIKMFFEPGI